LGLYVVVVASVVVWTVVGKLKMLRVEADVVASVVVVVVDVPAFCSASC